MPPAEVSTVRESLGRGPRERVGETETERKRARARDADAWADIGNQAITDTAASVPERSPLYDRDRQGSMANPPPPDDLMDNDGQPWVSRRIRAAINTSREAARLARNRGLPRQAGDRTSPDPPRLPSDQPARPGRSQDLTGPDWTPPPRLVYSAALAGELRYARDGLHDWVTNPEAPVRFGTTAQARPGRREIPSGPLDRATPAVTANVDLRGSALTQAIRRHSRMSPRARVGLENYMLERARRSEQQAAELESTMTTATTTTTTTTAAAATNNVARHARLLRPPSMIQPSDRRHGIPTSELRSSVEAYRQRYLHHNRSDELTDIGGPLDDVIKYLDRVRSADADEHTLVACASGIMSQLTAPHRSWSVETAHDDLLVNTDCIPPPAETSWLRIGSVFEGTQHAAGLPSNVRRRPLPSSAAATDVGPAGETVASLVAAVAHPTTTTIAISTDGERTMTLESSEATDQAAAAANLRSVIDGQCCCAGDLQGAEHFDKWPVKVTIHSVDYDTMRLTGEMEAFDVPDRTAPESKSSITTYLEGEIIDLRRHTLETKNYRSSSRIDSIYWRKLLPFRGHSDVDIVQWLLSKKWLTEHISQEWILMRWKGTSLFIFLFFLKK